MKSGMAQSAWLHARLLKTGQTTQYGSGVGADDGFYQSGVPKSYVILTTGQYSGTTNISLNGKTDAHSNNCVFDQATLKMWSRTVSASVGPASDGLLPWTNTGSGATLEGIFAYCAAANLAMLSGYSDWRVPNLTELTSIFDLEASTAEPDSTTFPTWGTQLWSSTTLPTTANNAYSVTYKNNGTSSSTGKTTNLALALVRGG